MDLSSRSLHKMHTPANPKDFGLLTLSSLSEEIRLGLGHITGPLLVALEELRDNRSIGGGHAASRRVLLKGWLGCDTHWRQLMMLLPYIL